MSKVEDPEVYDECEDEDYQPEEEDRSEDSLNDTDDNSEASEGEEKSRRRKQTRSKKKSRKSQKEDHETDEPKETAEDEKKRADALWADFLSDVDPPPPSARKSSDSSRGEESNASKSPRPTDKSSDKTKTKDVEEKKKAEVVERVFDFAGEEVRVPVVENPEKATKRPAPASTSRSAAGGLAAVLGSIGKKPKISTLEKSKLDWNRFKQTEGINEEIERFNKGKDGYLERQDFLERTDYRQFDIERDMRQKKRSPR